MNISEMKQQKAAKEAELARIETRIKNANNYRIKLIGKVAETLLDNQEFKTAFINKARSLLTSSDLQKLDLTDRYGNPITAFEEE